MDVKISQLPAISAGQLDGKEYLFLQKGDTNYKVRVEDVAEYAVGSVIGEKNITIEIDGTTTGDLIVDTPVEGSVLDTVTIVVRELLSGDNASSVTLLAGDEVLMESVTFDDLNGSYRKINMPVTYYEIQAGEEVILRISGGNLTDGTFQILLKYLPDLN